MTTQSNNRGYQEIAFLDTNAIHYVRLYIDLADRDQLYPFSDDMEAAEAAIQKQDRSLRPAYGKGLDVVAFCKVKQLLIHYSHISTLELAVGRAKGEALQKAALQGVPERKWTGFANDDKQLAAYLDEGVLQRIGREMPQLVSQLDRLQIHAVSDDDSMVRVLALKLAALMYMATADCMIFAHALTVQAKYVVTYDAYFRKIVNRVYNSPKCDEIRRQIDITIPGIQFPRSPGKDTMRDGRRCASPRNPPVVIQ